MKGCESMLIVNHSIDIVRDLVEAKQLLRTVNPPYTPKQFKNLTYDQLLDLLMKQLLLRCRTDDVDLLTYNHYTHACGCMGPDKDETFCPCDFSCLVEQYKEDLALKYLLNKQEINNV